MSRRTTLNAYQRAAMRTAADVDRATRVLGLVSEVGEIADLYKDAAEYKVQHGTPAAAKLYTNLLDEFGDALWYLTACIVDAGFDLEQVANRNIEKLEERHPRGFEP